MRPRLSSSSRSAGRGDKDGHGQRCRGFSLAAVLVRELEPQLGRGMRPEGMHLPMKIKLTERSANLGVLQVILICLAFPSFGQEAGKLVSDTKAASPVTQTVKDAYSIALIDEFHIQKDVDFPAAYLDALQKETMKQLVSAKLFAEVISEGQKPANPESRVLRMTGLITNYKPGNRAARYFGGYGAGATEIDSKLTFLDAATEQPILSEELRAMLTGGFFGGKSEGALTDYARQLVNKTKLMVYMRLPAPGTTPNAATAATGGTDSSTPPLRHLISITSKDWPGSQLKLNSEATEGYRVASVTITGKETANVELLRADAIADQYQYRLVHPAMSTNLQKDMRRATEEGFRATPHSLVILGNSLTMIMEKSSPPFKDHYQYAVKETLRVSTGQKETEKLQNEGYALIGELEHGGAHLLLFEKIAPPE